MENKPSTSDNHSAIFLLLGCSLSILTFVGGIIIGLVVFGWLLWPVQWVDATPTDLRHEYQQIYIEMVLEAFEDSNDLNQARYRLHPWEDAAALELLDEALHHAIREGAAARAEAIQYLINSYELSSP